MLTENVTEVVLKTETYCLDSLRGNIEHAGRCGVSSDDARFIMYIAMLVLSALEKGDMSRGLLLSVENTDKDSRGKHLIREYIASGKDIIIRLFLDKCNHDAVLSQKQIEVSH